MDTPIKEPKRISGRKARVDMKVGDIKRHKAKSGITKKELFAILDKASQPIKHETKPDSKENHND